MTIRRVQVLAVAAALAAAGCSGSVVSGHGTAQGSIPSTGSLPTGFPSSASISANSSSADTTGRIVSPDADFSVVLPAGWQDSSDKASSFGALTAYLGPTSDGFATNVNVVRQDVGAMSASDYADLTRRGVRSLHVSAMSATSPRTVDSEDALEYTFTDQQVGRTLKQRQTVVVHDQKGYVITYTALPSSYDTSVPAADSLIDSWQWG